MYFDENTAKVIDLTNNALRKFSVGALADYEVIIDWSDTRHQIVQIKRIIQGEYTRGFFGYKSIVIPSLMVENIETNEVFDVVKFQEGGWSEFYGKKSYHHPEIWPFAEKVGKGSYPPPKPSDSSYSARSDISLTILSKLEAKKLLEDKIAKQAAAQEDARRAALLDQQQQRELQRQNDAIKDSDIAALLNKYKNNR